ncbi:MAG: anaerobic ribonucleoside-triphosphate reductase activating protein [Clostridia bacterium]
MRIAGIQINSFVDFPENIAAVVFVGGCNMRCWYCHNADILETKEFLDEEKVLAKIKDNLLLDGVVISGGEPTLQADMLDFAQKIKDMGLNVKLDTNGLRPEVLQKALDSGLVDYVAMDIKAPLDKGFKVTPTMMWNEEKLRKSIDILRGQNKIPYEFRLTVIPQFTLDEIVEVAKTVAGARVFYLQKYVDHGKGFKSPTGEFLEEAKKLCDQFVPTVVR